MCNRINKKHKVAFKVDENVPQKAIDVYHSIKVYYDKSDDYHGLSSVNGGGDFSLYLDDSYLSLDFDIESKRVGNFGGMFCLDKAIKKQINLPNKIISGILLVKTNADFISGTGWRIKFKLKPCFDNKTKVLQFGNCNSKKPLYKVLSNVYVQLSSKGSLKGILINNLK